MDGRNFFFSDLVDQVNNVKHMHAFSGVKPKT